LLWESDYKSTKNSLKQWLVWYAFAIFSSENRNDTNMKHFIIIMVTALAGWTIAPAQTQTNHAFFRNLFQQANAGKTVIKGNYVPDWAYYHNRQNNGTYTYVDLGLNEVTSLDRDLMRCTLTLTGGCSTESAAHDLCQLLFGDWKNTGSMVLAGATWTAGTLSVYAYMHDTTGFGLRTSKMFKGTGLTGNLSYNEEPDWNAFATLLMPGAEQLQEIWNERFVAQMKDKKDNSILPHLITHTLHFASADSRKAFLTQASAKGFQQKDVSNDARMGDYPFSATITRNDPTDLKSINLLTGLLWQLASSNNGVYESWTTQVKK
jgi:hypothetical protein